MKPLISAQRALAQRIVARLQGEGFQAYFVGGCVRDQVMGVEPKDYDVATSAEPERVEALFQRTLALGKAFGVIAVLELENPSVQVEVATFREDGDYHDGRHPEEVQFSSAEHDALRRDFTINGLFYDPVAEQVIDYVGGLEDIREKRLRAIGLATQRFEEDKLRMLRALRFASRFNFHIESDTYEALCQLAPRIQQVSVERIRAELDGILLGPARGRGLRMLFETGLLDAILPEIAHLSEVEIAGRNLFGQTCAMLDLADKDSLELAFAWALLLHGLGLEGGSFPCALGDREVQVLCQRIETLLKGLKHDNALIKKVLGTLELWYRGAFRKAELLSLAALKRLLREPAIGFLIELEKMATSFGYGERKNVFFLQHKLQEYEVRDGVDPLRPRLPLRGADLQEFGLKPGPLYRQILQALEDQVLEEKVHDRASALIFVRHFLDQRGITH